MNGDLLIWLEGIQPYLPQLMPIEEIRDLYKRKLKDDSLALDALINKMKAKLNRAEFNNNQLNYNTKKGLSNG